MIINGKTYISSRRAGEIFGYTNDYVGQLARAGKIESTIVGRSRYVDYSSISDYVRVANGAIKRIDGNSEAQLAPVISSKSDFVFVPKVILDPKIELAEYTSSRDKRIFSVEQIERSLVVRNVAPRVSTKHKIDAFRLLVGACAILGTLLFFTGSLIGGGSLKFSTLATLANLLILI